MGKWKYHKEYNKEANFDHHVSIDKMRSKRGKLKKATKEEDSFIKPLTEWQLGGVEGAFMARVVEVQKRYAFINPETPEGDIDTRDVQLATVSRRYLSLDRKERNLIVVGDRVLCKPDVTRSEEEQSDLPRCVILNVAPRTTRIVRCDPMTPEREHVLASNIDQLVIVASYLRPKIRWRLIDRYLILAEEQGIPAILVFNKADLLETDEASPQFVEECRSFEELYRALGYQVFSLSTLNMKRRDAQWKALKDVLSNKISILSGHSGVGKSSLVNLFKPEIEQEVEENPNIFYKGRHTTTYASFIRLGTGGFVVDTPGVRSFLLGQRDVIGLSHCFVEFRPLMAKCKFRECRHVNEPGCAVLDAMIQGEIHESRYRSYLSILSGESAREGKGGGDSLD
jgi:ribosome biogenesis GTPase